MRLGYDLACEYFYWVVIYEGSGFGFDGVIADRFTFLLMESQKPG